MQQQTSSAQVRRKRRTGWRSPTLLSFPGKSEDFIYFNCDSKSFRGGNENIEFGKAIFYFIPCALVAGGCCWYEGVSLRIGGVVAV